MIHRILLSVVVLGLLTTWRDSARAEQVFVRVVGQVTLLFDHWYNPFTTAGDTDLAEYGQVEDFSWNIVSPRDAASGLPTGKLMHRPATLRLRRSGATVSLATAMANNENLTEVKVAWFAPHPDTGLVELVQELILTNASVAGFSTYTVREQGGLTTYVDVTFYYQVIGIEDFASGLSFEVELDPPTD